MNRLYNGTVPPCLSSAITVVPALSEDTMSTCMLAPNFTSGLHAINKSSNGKLCSGPYVTEPSDSDTQLLSTHSSLLCNSRPLMMDFPEVSEQISSNQEQLLGLFDYPSSVGFPNPQNVTAFGQQVQDTIITDPNTRVGGVALQNEWFSSGSSMQLPKNLMQEVQHQPHLKVIRTAVLKEVYRILSTVMNFALTTCLLQILLQSQGYAGHLSSMSVLLMLLTSWGGAKVEATPKAVQKVMKVEGLTIYHVKSHLQKYRTVQHRPESSDGQSVSLWVRLVPIFHADSLHRI
ncbi:myb family transcription factor PHL13-like isoform X2 [Panicum hallii]|uniref:myb family transcription factor PHL13-like isoform X2 n=1 Tax=Panicum hallii TaxID=206008 RepID=UPI000DF4D898|nr:myb family transcription factor PHL13-like isoform X2 [Panicum hallii]